MSIEERLARDIAAVTGGVVMTESDLKDARDTVDKRIMDSRRKTRRRALAAVAAAVVVPVLGIAAFQALDGDDKVAPPAELVPTSPDVDDAFLSGTAPTPELLEGVWRVDGDTLLVRFSPPDRVFFDNGGQLYGSPAVEGTYRVEEDLITVTVDGGGAGCGGQTFAMRAALPEPGMMHFVHTEPGVNNCSPQQDEQWALEQVLPTSQSLSGFELSSEFPKGDGDPPAPGVPLYGDWMAEGGGHILELTQAGSYYIAGASGDVIDTGQWTHRGSTLSLTSSAASEQCAQGDQLVWTGLEYINPHTSAMRGAVDKNACDGAWAGPTVWILLPHE